MSELDLAVKNCKTALKNKAAVQRLAKRLSADLWREVRLRGGKIR